MSGNAQSSSSTRREGLTGPEKVAILLLALGKERARKILKRFDPDDLKLVSRSVGGLPALTTSDLETLVEEFAQRFSTGLGFVGSAAEIRELFAGAMSEEQLEEVFGDKKFVESGEPVWKRIADLKVDVLRAFLLKEHPQTVAVILSRIEPEAAAKVVTSFPSELRNGLVRRMLAISKVSDEAVRAVEAGIRDVLLASPSAGLHMGIADILNRLDKSQTDEVIKSISEVRPDDAKALKSLLFTFEEIVTLPQKARTALLDQIPAERLVLALRGTEADFQAAVLSSLASRSRRMVEAELQGGSAASPKDIAAARRQIVDGVLKMISKGVVELHTPDVVDELTIGAR
jgi:flagellar motor switch protein FliG